MKKFTFLSLLVFIIGFAGNAQVFSLLKDINQVPQPAMDGSLPNDMVIIDGILYFSATSVNTGMELWKSDGTAAGTTLVKDIWPGRIGSSPARLANVDGILYFFSSDPIHGMELWRSDGTESGTRMVKDINPGMAMGSSGNIAAINGILYFWGNDGVNGPEIWRSDGTESGTMLLKDIVPRSEGSNPVMLLVSNGWLYFSARDANPGFQLWKSDGSSAGTSLLRTGLGTLSNFTEMNGVIYFAVSYPDHLIELWRTDGTAQGTMFVSNINHSLPGKPKNFTVMNNTLFFIMENTNMITLWKSDGLPGGTSAFKSFPISMQLPEYHLTPYEGKLYFDAPYNAGMNFELWQTDGSAEGTSLVKEIMMGSGGSNPFHFTEMNGTLYFAAASETGMGIWKTDGTSEGTVLVKQLRAGSEPALIAIMERSIASANGIMYFSGNDGLTGYELWKSDGTPEGTMQLKDIHKPANGSAFDEYTFLIAGPGNWLYFTANDGLHGEELWKTDGNPAGTSMVKDIRPGPSGNILQELVLMNGILYFAASDDVNGIELWRSDGTTAGTYMVRDINAGSASSEPGYLKVMGNILYFNARTAANGDELWRSDGTAAGTVLVKDILPGAGRGDPMQLVVAGNQLFFTASNGTNGTELWKSDGTAAGTVMVKDIVPGAAGSAPLYLTPGNGIVFFNATTPAAGSELWQSDGTSAGTFQIADINSGPGSGNPRYFTWLSPNLFFVANHPNSGDELWVLNQRGNFSLVSDINPGTGGSNPMHFKVIDNKLYFVADNGVAGNELWKLEPYTSLGMVKDYWPGPGSGGGTPFGIRGRVFFNGNDGISGEEPVRSDGTASGTVLLQDIQSPGGSNPEAFMELGGYVYAVMSNDVTGIELWIANLATALPLTLLEFSGQMKGEDAWLTWRTENEQNSLSFDVERSYDGIHFKPAGTVAARNTPGTHHYEFTDPQPGSQDQQIIYYRLKINDRDGKFEYSRQLYLQTPVLSTGIDLYPNPARDQFFLKFKLRAPQNINACIYDATGRMVQMQQWELQSGHHNIPVDLLPLAAGKYFLKLTAPGFNEILEVVKQ